MRLSCGQEHSEAEILDAASSITRTVNRKLASGAKRGRPRSKCTPEQVKFFRDRDWPTEEFSKQYSFRKIGQILGISASKAHSLYRQAVQKPAGEFKNVDTGKRQ
jgi:hypothetical protein